MSEPGRDPPHLTVAGAERFPHPLAERRRMAAEIDGDVKDLSAQTDLASLRLLDLEMETAHHVFVGEGLIVLNGATPDPDLRHSPFHSMPLRKGTSTIFERPRAQGVGHPQLRSLLTASFDAHSVPTSIQART